MESLSALLPIRLQAGDSLPALQQRLRRLGAGLTAPACTAGGQATPHLSADVGVDEDDAILAGAADLLRCCFPPAVEVAVHVFGGAGLAAAHARASGAAPICWMWSQLAAAAGRAFRPGWTVLLGDDVAVGPPGWPQLLSGFVAGRPHLRCVALLDAADPGFPSFPVVSSSHLEVGAARACVLQGGNLV